MSDPTPQPLHGPGGLLATPGLGARRKRRWGQRLKAKQIVGNLYRGDNGKFQAGGASSPAGAKPVRGVQLSKQPKPTKRTPVKTAAPKKAGGGKGKAPKPKDPAVAARQAQRDQEHAEDRATRAADRAQRQADRQARLARQAERDRERAKKAGESAAKKIGDKLAQAKPAKAGGGGSKKPKDDKRGDKAKKAAETAQQVGMATADLEALRQAAEGLGGAQSAKLSQLGLLGADGLATDQGRRALSALERGDVRQYQAALQDARNRLGRETAAADRKQQTQLRRETAKRDRDAKQQRRLDALKRQAQRGGKLTQSQRDQLTEAGMASDDGQMWRLKTHGLDTGTRRTAAQRVGTSAPVREGLRTRHGWTQPAAADQQAGRITRQSTSGAGQRIKAYEPGQLCPYCTADLALPNVGWYRCGNCGESFYAADTDSDYEDYHAYRADRAQQRGAPPMPVSMPTARVLKPPRVAEKSLVVYKDHAGQMRWIARTTTAYRDRDGEIIASDALDHDSQRMTATKQFGPLRYWHVGQPDPFDTTNPCGPGLDIGDCDYSVLIGRTRIESGTFRDPAIAQKVARNAAQYELSPGFFHPIDQPDQDGVFHAIRTFERSIVPTRYGRASNLFTGFAVKEQRMDITEMEKRFKAAIVDLGLDAAQAAALGQQLVATEKEATAQGIAFKSDEQPRIPGLHADPPPEPVYYNAGNEPGVIRDGLWMALKAAPPAEVMEAVEEQADDPMMEEMTEEVVEEPAGDYLGDMSWDEFAAKLADLLAPVLKMQDMVKAMGDAHAELKTMYGGAATKDDARAAEIAALKSQQTELAQRLALLEGDQPAVTLPADVEAALKSDGPAAPAAPPKIVDVVSDPNRPWAGWAAQSFPELYQIGE